ncbi:hypothetical protein GNZ12_12520 [Paraburkholderia sp. 1N]|uniref:Uncharacterized protein n=1 Tax=Paraburkholderia solitsugae TaxID=2675748 RepID=A0ABX2BMZ5_9BURK|nr:hypothetical protein [Paraburkholderia solitsugae]NPT42126.1 hypothetical protein [Paraburkholderia solitsugae]
MFSLWFLILATASFLFFIHCLDWAFLIRNRQLLGYFVHTPTHFAGDLASMVAYFVLLALCARQALGIAHADGLYVMAALTVEFIVGHRRANAGLRAAEEEYQ